jgi:hypothetical protein
MSVSKQIEKLKEELKILEEQKKQQLFSDYSHLVGKYFCINDFRWDKITSINKLELCNDGSIFIDYRSISIFYEEDGNSDQEYGIYCRDWNEEYIHDLERSHISEKKFIEIFDKVVDIVKSKI